MNNQNPVRPTDRNKVYDVVDGERDYQVKNHPTSPSPDITHFTNLLIEYTDKLAVDVAVNPSAGMSPAHSPSGGPLKRLREIAAIAIHAMEVHGAAPRGNHVPASAGVTGTVNIVGKADSTKPSPKPAAPAPAPARTAPAPTPHPAPTAAPVAPAAPVQHPHPAGTAERDVEHHQAAPAPQHDTTEHGKK